MTSFLIFLVGLAVGLFMGWLAFATLQEHIAKPVRDE